MEQVLNDLILQTMNPETVQQATEKLQPLLQDFNSIPAFFNLFTESNLESIKTASLMYICQIIKDKWNKIPGKAQNQIKQFILSLFSQQIIPNHIRIICDIIGIIYKKDIGDWPELVSVIFNTWNTFPFISSHALLAIIDLFEWDKQEDQIPHFIEIVLFFMTSNEQAVQVAGLQIFSTICGSILDFEGTIKLLEIANQMAVNSLNYSKDDFASIWNSISAIISALENPNQEVLEAFRQTAFQIGANRQIESTFRILPITTLVNGAGYFLNFFEQIVDLCIDLIAQTIEETESLPFDMLDIVETLMKSQEIQQSYSIISAKIMQILQSGSISHMTAALLILRVLLIDAPEYAFKDVQKIVELLQQTISSDNPIFIQAAASVIESFKDTFPSINVFGVELLKAILPYTISNQAEVRHHCLSAVLIICDNIDSEIPKFFDTIWNLYTKSSPDDMTLFFTLLAIAIKLTPDFDDDNVETILRLLQDIIQKEDLLAISSSMTIIHALIKFDSELAQQLIPMIMPYIGPCLNFENENVISMTVYFLENCITFFHESAIQMIVPFTSKLIEFITGSPSENIRATSLITIARLAKYDEDNNTRNMIAPVLIKSIDEFMDAESTILQISGSKSIRPIARLLNENQSFQFFNKLVNQIENHISIKIIEECIQSISKLLKVSQQQRMIETAMKLLVNMINGEVSFLHGLPLIQIDTAIILFGKICNLITSLISLNCPITNQICDFLLQWLKRDSELDKPTAIGALSDAILYDAVSPEICQTIVNTVAEYIPKATHPGLQENIIYLFNICVIKQQQLLPSIMSVLNIFTEWWENAINNESGYSDVIDNLCSLFLGLAIAVPEFPEDALCRVFDKFPRADNMNNSLLCRNVITLLDSRQNIGDKLKYKITISIAKLLMFDKLLLNDMQIDNELLQQMQNIMIAFLRQIPNALPEIQQMCSRSKSKSRRLLSAISIL